MNFSLHIFGDSNSLPFFGNAEESEKYRIYKGGTLPKGWMELLSENINYNLVLHSRMGNSNADIFQSICKNIEQVKIGDIVIVGWTFRMRFQVVSEYLNNYFSFSSVMPSYLTEHSLLKKECMEELLIHKNHEYWVNEIYIWEKLLIHLSKVAGFEIYFWSFDEMIGKSYLENCDINYYLGKNNLDEYYKSESYKKLNTGINSEINFTKDGFWKHLELLGMKQICEETNNEVNDGHIDEMGHKILSDLFLYQINKRR